MKARDQAVQKRRRNQESVEWLPRYYMIHLVSCSQNPIKIDDFLYKMQSLYEGVRPRPLTIKLTSIRYEKSMLYGCETLGKLSNCLEKLEFVV